MRPKTSCLAVIRRCPGRFTLGVIQEFIDVGPYTFVKYRDSMHQTLYAVYVRGVNTGRATYNLDSALVVAMTYKRNKSASYYEAAKGAMALIGIKDAPKRSVTI